MTAQQLILDQLHRDENKQNEDLCQGESYVECHRIDWLQVLSLTVKPAALAMAVVQHVRVQGFTARAS